MSGVASRFRIPTIRLHVWSSVMLFETSLAGACLDLRLALKIIFLYFYDFWSIPKSQRTSGMCVKGPRNDMDASFPWNKMRQKRLYDEEVEVRRCENEGCELERNSLKCHALFEEVVV